MLSYLFVVPMSCQHCFHRFHVSWFSTFGKQLHPPVPLQVCPESAGPSYAAQQSEADSPLVTTSTAERKTAVK
jgi:hypothetical protein